MPVILDEKGLKRTLVRLSHEIEEKNEGLDGVVLIGVKRGGEIVAERLKSELKSGTGVSVPTAGLDIGMTRDDLVSAFFVPDAGVNELGFDISGKKVVLCDDVLHTGRSAVAGIEALFRLGRPKGPSASNFSCSSTAGGGNSLSAQISWARTCPLRVRNM